MIFKGNDQPLHNPGANRPFLLNALLIVAWACVQLFFLYTYGIVTELEAAKYIYEAKQVIDHGQPSTPNFWLYSTQILLIAAAIQLKAGFVPVVIIQLIMNGIATIQLYRFLCSITNHIPAFLITLCFILNFPLQNFNVYLQTESLFFSLSVIFSCSLFQLKQLNAKTFVLTFGLLMLLCLTRPTGLLFIPCYLVYIFIRFLRFKASVYVEGGLIVSSFFIFLIILNKALGSGGELDLMLPFRGEDIICGVPTTTYQGIQNIYNNPNSIEGLVYYIIHHPGQFLSLAALRTQAFFGLSRNYYSSLHNLYLYLYIFPFYILAMAGIKKWYYTNKALCMYCIGYILLTWGTVILTCDDWHNRFLLTLIPYIYVLSVPGIAALMNYLKILLRHVSK